MMREFDDNIPARAFDNFQVVLEICICFGCSKLKFVRKWSEIMLDSRLPGKKTMPFKLTYKRKISC